MPNGDNLRGRRARPLLDRFLEAVEFDTNAGCWLWAKSLMTTGYGVIHECRWPEKTKVFSAHRFSYETFVGAIPPGMSVLHKCDVRLCVNPAHLFVGTRGDNYRDMIAKGRAWFQNAAFPSRERKPTSRFLLNEEAVRDIRQKRMSQPAYGRLYGVGKTTISAAQTGATWSWVR